MWIVAETVIPSLFRPTTVSRQSSESVMQVWRSDRVDRVRHRQAEDGVAELKSEIKDLEEDRLKMKNQILTLERRIEAHKTRATERRQVDIEKRAEEIKFLEFQRNHLNDFRAHVEAQWESNEKRNNVCFSFTLKH